MRSSVGFASVVARLLEMTTGASTARQTQQGRPTGTASLASRLYGSIDASNPQSLNRYSYVNNMPFNFTDPSGLAPLGCGFGASTADGVLSITFATGNPLAWVGLGACLYTGIEDLLHLFYHPKFTASHVPRPGAHVWDEHGSYTAKPNNGIGDLLGLSGAGCEFGACGSSFGPGMCTLYCTIGHAEGDIKREYTYAKLILTLSYVALDAFTKATVKAIRNEQGDRCSLVRQEAIASCGGQNVGQGNHEAPVLTRACVRAKMNAQGCYNY